MDEALARRLAALSAAYGQFSQLATELGVNERQQPGVCGDWSGKEVVAHLAGWDELMRIFISAPEAFEPPHDVDVFNAHSVSQRAHLTWDQSLVELCAGFRGLQDSVATVTVDMANYGRVSSWLQGRIDDYDFHSTQLRTWTRQSGDTATAT